MDRLFQVHPLSLLYHHNMGLALMIYGIAERKLREALEMESERIPDQRNKPTKKPTMRRVFQAFERITVL